MAGPKEERDGLSVPVAESVVSLRLVVGFLGEKGQAGWWTSSFLDPSARPFLLPVFPKTILLARCRGVTEAAARVHDERIGVGSVFHLFRLPEDLEQSIHRFLEGPETTRRLADTVSDARAAMAYLESLASSKIPSGSGPVRAGTSADLGTATIWGTVAGCYLSGFQRSVEVFPYFSAA